MEDIPWTAPITSSEFEKLTGLDVGSVQDMSVKSLTKPGQNYGSLMLGITLRLRDGRTVQLVGKFMPPTSLQREIFASATSFLKEANVYRRINESLLLLQRQRGIREDEVVKPLPRYYGSRVNAAEDDSLDADENAVILLQNLVVDGYRMGDQMLGLNLTHAKMVVASLARFQATAVALKLLQPEVFRKVVDERCVFTGMGTEKLSEPILVHLASFPEIVPYCERIKAVHKQTSKVPILELLASDVEPFVSVSHNDLWVNNIMFRYASSNCDDPLDVKFFDFQTVSYSSIARDLIFFLYSSLEYNLIATSVDYLIDLYYDRFMSWLRKLKCDTSMFEEKKFRTEIHRVAPTELMHILVMLNVICADEHEKINVSDLDIAAPPFSFGVMYRKKTQCVVEDFVKRGWL